MTTPKAYLESLVGQTEPMKLSLPPIPIKVNKQDFMAARLLLWLHEQMPEDATQGDLDDVLDAAKWWATFFAALEEQ